MKIFSPVYLLDDLLWSWLIVSAPGSYDVDKVEWTIHQSSPAYSFGQKYKDKKPDDIPGKLSYCIVWFDTLLLFERVTPVSRSQREAINIFIFFEYVIKYYEI